MDTYQDPTDRQLLDRFYAGDDEAFDVLYQRYLKALFFVAARILRNKDMAEEVAHDVFLALLAKPNKLFGEEMNVRAWLFRVCANKCISLVRGGDWKSRAELPDIDGIPAATSLAFSQVFGRTSQRFPDCLKQLTDEERWAVTLRHFLPEEPSNIEIAGMMGIDPSYASKITTRAKNKLKVCLEL